MVDQNRFYGFLTNSLSTPEMIEVEQALLAEDEGQAILHALASSYETNRELADELLGKSESNNDRFIDNADSTYVEQSKIKTIMDETLIYEFTSSNKKEFEAIVNDVQSKEDQELVEYLAKELGKTEDDIRNDLESISKGLDEKFTFSLDEFAPEEIKQYLRKVKADYASANSNFYAEVYTSLFEVKAGTTAKEASDMFNELSRMDEDTILNLIVGEIGKEETGGFSDEQLERFVGVCSENAHCNDQDLRAVAISCYVMFNKRFKKVDPHFIGQSIGTYNGLIKSVAGAPETTREKLLRYAKLALIYLAIIALLALMAYMTAFVVGKLVLLIAELATVCPGFLTLVWSILSGLLHTLVIASGWALVLFICDNLADKADNLKATQEGLDKVNLVVRKSDTSEDKKAKKYNEDVEDDYEEEDEMSSEKDKNK